MLLTKKDDLFHFITQEKILQFGSFVTNSGRTSPYFCNFGNLADPLKLELLGSFYADKIIEVFGEQVDNVFGPAYKGISLSIATATSLSKKLNKKVTFTFNRKEAKDHGEKGLFVGHSYTGNEKVVVVEDVLTSGKSLTEAYHLLAKTPCSLLGSLVYLDREEQNKEGQSAKKALEEDSRVPLVSLVNITEVFEYLKKTKHPALTDEILHAINCYQANYLNSSKKS